MGYKDTVMDDRQLARAFNSYGDELVSGNWDLHCEDDLRNVASAQAEISFKAGRESLLEGIKHGEGIIHDLLKEKAEELVKMAAREEVDKALEIGKKEGIKEVVDWVNDNGDEIKCLFEPKRIGEIAVDYDKWQNQCKEWGINPW